MIIHVTCLDALTFLGWGGGAGLAGCTLTGEEVKGVEGCMHLYTCAGRLFPGKAL